jgi:GNAT superfamily N-acetyltransferase
MAIGLRWATTKDAAAITRLVNRAFLVEAFFVEGNRTSAAAVRRMLERGGFLLAEEAGRLLACVFVEVRGERGYFGLLAVDPSRQGEGLGARLVGAAEEHCARAGCRVMDISVVDLRRELPPFYRKLGYRRTGTQPFPDPHRAKRPCQFLLMSKRLSGGAPARRRSLTARRRPVSG